MKANANSKEIKSSPYYIFNNGNNEGFVIISGNDRVQKVLGYSDSGNFDPNNVPPQLKALMERWSKQIAKISDSEGPAHASWQTSFNTRAGEGVQLETVNWGQGYPYNLKSPIIDGVQAPSGCVATSMAIAMKYYNWPETTQGKVYTNFENREQTVDYSSSQIDWTALSGNPESDEFKEAVSNLNLLAGAAVDTHYTPEESSADLVLLGHKLMENFKYSPDCQFIERKHFDDQTWNKMITDQLDAEQIVIYFGNAGMGTSGHAFVIDGYSNDGLYHINWGWDGFCNGSFSLASLDPNDSNFTECQGMVMNIVPDKSGAKYSRAFVSNTDMYISDFQSNDRFNFNVTEIKPGEKFSFIAPHVIIPWHNFHGDIALAIMDENNNIVKKMFYDDGSDYGWRMFGCVSDDGCHFPGVLMTFLEMESPGLEAGQRYQLVCREKGESEWLIVNGGIIRPTSFGDKDLYSDMCNVNLHYDKEVPILMQTETTDSYSWMKGDGYAKSFYYAGGDVSFEFKCYDAEMNEQEPVFVDDFWDHKQGAGFNLTLKYPFNDVYIHWKKYENNRHDEGKDPSTIFTVDGLVYEIVDNSATLLGYEVAEKEILVIPDFIEVNEIKYPVTAIENNALTYYDSLRHVELGANITIVHPYAFGLLPNLESIGISSLVDFGRMPANWSDNLNTFYFKNPVAQQGQCDFLNRYYGDTWFDVSFRPVKVYIASLEDYNRVPIRNATSYVPGSGQKNFYGGTEMWEYAIDRSQHRIKVQPLIDELKIENVIVNGEQVSPKNNVYKVGTTNDMNVEVNFKLNDCQPMTTTYSASYNSSLPSTTISGVEEIFDEAAGNPVDVYNLQGVRIISNASMDDLNGLPTGIYIVGGKKIRID